ncbi:hypothetical protein BDW59DRAFT_176265 [Aspergillus cavernicola]|uniref:Rhodopsin domain-containing protein n=1 Tax=Aspergillus cavernicola TaxID=176166 RepID=A0ABR4HHT5_9EURO
MAVYKISEAAFLAILWVCVGVQCLFLLTRFILRLKIDRRWVAEDIFVFIAWLLSVGNTCLWTVVHEQLYFVLQLSKAQTSDIHLPENIRWVMARYLRSQLAGYYLSYFSLWCIKLSFMFFFYNLGNKYRLQRILWWTVLVLLILSLGGCLGMLDYGCELTSFEDMIENCLSPRSIWYERVSLRVATALDIVTDAAIIFLSGNSLWRTRITGRRKLALVGISLLTAFIIIIALIRMLLGQSSAGVQDPAWLIAWNAIEILVAIIVACLASFWTLYTKSKQSKFQFKPSSFGYRTDNTSMEAPIMLEDHDATKNATHQQPIMLNRRLDTPKAFRFQTRERL